MATIPSLIDVDAAVSAYDELQRYSSCVAICRSLLQAMQAGAVLIDRSSREKALRDAQDSGVYHARGDSLLKGQAMHNARHLLKLEDR